jgi:SAM-dependent methyltransferase
VFGSRWQLARLRFHWNHFARRDPLWAILTDPIKKGGRWSPDEFFRSGQDEVARLVEQLEQNDVRLPAGRALDFGCGIGRVTAALADRFDEVVGVDVAPAMLDLARDMNAGRRRCRFVLNDRPDLSLFADGTFDFVYSKLVLQHMRPKLAAGYIGEMLRVLRPDGLLVFQLPTPIEYPVLGGRLKRSVPRPVVAVYRRIKKLVLYGLEFPKMEVHGIPAREVTRLVERSSGVVIRRLPDQSHGLDSPGFLYVAAKSTGSHRFVRGPGQAASC